MNKPALTVLIGIVGLPFAAVGQVSIILIPFQGTDATPGSISGDGRCVVGQARIGGAFGVSRAFLWRESEGATMLPLLNPWSGSDEGSAWSTDRTGTVTTGVSDTFGVYPTAWRWPGYPPELLDLAAWAVSPDGGSFCGTEQFIGGSNFAFAKIGGAPAAALVSLPGFTDGSTASSLSEGGSAVVGACRRNEFVGTYEDPYEGGTYNVYVTYSMATTWTASGPTPLGTLPGHNSSFAMLVSPDGRTVVGTSQRIDVNTATGDVTVAEQAAWRSRDGGPPLPLTTPGDGAIYPGGISADGNTVLLLGDFQGLLWDAAAGLWDLNQLLPTLGVNMAAFPFGFNLSGLSVLAEDGRTLAASASRPGTGNQTYRITLPAVLPVNCVPATISGQPAAVGGCPGAVAEFSVLPGGTGPFSFLWRRDGEAIETAGNPSAATATLTLPGAVFADAGVYDCVVTNTCGSAVSEGAGLTMCVGDYNCDGGIDGGDTGAFFADWEASLPGADTNRDGGVDGADVDTFFAAWESGAC